jgi:hypothetical protein
VCGLGQRAARVDGLLDIAGTQRAMATHAACQGHNMVGGAESAEALGAVRALPGEALGLVPRGFHRWGDRLQAGDALRRTARATLGTPGMSHGAGLVRRLARRFGLGDRLGGSPLCGGHRA